MDPIYHERGFNKQPKTIIGPQTQTVKSTAQYYSSGSQNTISVAIYNTHGDMEDLFL